MTNIETKRAPKLRPPRTQYVQRLFLKGFPCLKRRVWSIEVPPATQKNRRRSIYSIKPDGLFVSSAFPFTMVLLSMKQTAGMTNEVLLTGSSFEGTPTGKFWWPRWTKSKKPKIKFPTMITTRMHPSHQTLK
jgi:hypothetical protein